MFGNTADASGYWLASPAAYSGEFGNDNLMFAGNGAIANAEMLNYGQMGFRPIVCLNSGVQLEEISSNTFKIK